MSDKDQPSLLGTLIGRQISSVEFVQNYVQLRFDGPCLTAFLPPDVITGGRRYRWGEMGYRDALCARIAQIVQHACEIAGEKIEIAFPDGTRLEVSLRSADYPDHYSDAAMFNTGEGPWEVWQL